MAKCRYFVAFSYVDDDGDAWAFSNTAIERDTPICGLDDTCAVEGELARNLDYSNVEILNFLLFPEAPAEAPPRPSPLVARLLEYVRARLANLDAAHGSHCGCPAHAEVRVLVAEARVVGGEDGG